MKRNIIMSILSSMIMVLFVTEVNAQKLLGGRIGYDIVAGENASVSILDIHSCDSLTNSYDWEMKIAGANEWTTARTTSDPSLHNFNSSNNCIIRRKSIGWMIPEQTAYSNNVNYYKLTDKRGLEVKVGGNNAILLDAGSIYGMFNNVSTSEPIVVSKYSTSPYFPIVDTLEMIPMNKAITIDTKKVKSVEKVGEGNLYLITFVSAIIRDNNQFCLSLTLENSSGTEAPLEISMVITLSLYDFRNQLRSSSIADINGLTEAEYKSDEQIRIVTNELDAPGKYNTRENLSVWWEASRDGEHWYYRYEDEIYRTEYSFCAPYTMYIRRCISDGVDIAYSNAYLAKVTLADMDGGEIATNRMQRYQQCDYIISNIRDAKLDDFKNIEYTWEKSVDSVNWESIPDANFKYYKPSSHSSLIYYRRKAKYDEYEVYSNVVYVEPFVQNGGTICLRRNEDDLYYIECGTQPEFDSNVKSSVWQEASRNSSDMWRDIPDSQGCDSLALPTYQDIFNKKYRRVFNFDNGGKAYTNEIYPCAYYGNAIVSHKINNNCAYSSIMYYDGLGRHSRTVIPGGAASAESSPMKDIITPVVYDNMGRDDAMVYLPFADNSYSSGNERQEFEQLQRDYYQTLYGDDGEFAYKKTTYDSSPIGKINSVRNVGKIFDDNNKRTTYSYQTNDANEVYSLIYNYNDGLPDIRVDGYCPESSLAKTITVNEDGHTMIIYQDFLGNTIMSRQVHGNENIDTYYVYDSCNRLCLVIPPAESAKFLSCDFGQENYFTIANGPSEPGLQCYHYVYDGAGNCIEKQVPGSEPVYYIYNISDTVFTDYPVAMQDGNLRNNNTWILMNYDNHKRPSSTTYVTINAPMSGTEISLDKHDFGSLEEFTSYYERFLSVAGTIHKYFYDSYDNNMATGSFIPVPGVVSELDVDMRANGLLTAEQIYLLDRTVPNKFVRKTYYYDIYGRTIQTVEEYPDGAVARYSVKYDMAGNILSSHESHTHGDSVDYIKIDHELDHRGRILQSSVYVNGSNQDEAETDNETPVLSVAYTYDDLGTLLEKHTYLMGEKVIDEKTTYNIQGWLTGKSVYRPEKEDDPDYSSEIFTEGINYFYSLYEGDCPSYTGNIAGVSVYMADQDPVYTSYYYDSLSRLCDAEQYVCSTPHNKFVEKDITYDANGNIQGLSRYKNSYYPSTYTYTYYDSGLLKSVSNGEQLNAASCVSSTIRPPITDRPIHIATLPSLYKDDTTVYEGAEYVYDSNGNIIYDGCHGLNIRYNHLNLPRKISRGSDILAKYVYLANGSKYSALRDDGAGFIYEGSFIYSKDIDGSLRLEGIPFDGGRFIVNSNGDILPRYFITDHLGSVRGVLNENCDFEEQNDYYSYGKHVDDPYSQISENRYRYNGKENMEFFDIPYLDYGARLFDPNIGRWLQPDPMAEEYQSISPFAFCGNNPITNIDFDGNKWVDANGAEVWDKEKGTWKEGVSEDIKNLGNTLRSTLIGEIQFNYLIEYSNDVEVVFLNFKEYKKQKEAEAAAEGKQVKIAKMYGAVKLAYIDDKNKYHRARIFIFDDTATDRKSKYGIEFSKLESEAICLGHEIEHLKPTNAVRQKAHGDDYDSKDERKRHFAYTVIEEYPKEVTKQLTREFENKRFPLHAEDFLKSLLNY